MVAIREVKGRSIKVEHSLTMKVYLQRTVRNEMDRKNLTVSEVAELASVSEKSLRMLIAKGDCEVDTLLKVLSTLGCSLTIK